MTAAHARYEDWLASLGNPEHHVIVGPDWWGCLCGEREYDRDPYVIAWQHLRRFAAEPALVPWRWAHTDPCNRTVAELHRVLWETGDIDPRRD